MIIAGSKSSVRAHHVSLVSFPCFGREIGVVEPRPSADTVFLGGHTASWNNFLWCPLEGKRSDHPGSEGINEGTEQGWVLL